MHLKDILTLFFGLSAASLIAACSTIAQVDYALAGAPDTPFEKKAEVTTKFMKPDEVSKTCRKLIDKKSLLPSWYHACSYLKSNGDIVMIMPIPGSISDVAFGKVIYHEYQHVGQALTNKEIDHEHWR